MLDFYLLPQGEPMPDDDTGLEKAGSIELGAFERLQRFNIIEDDVSAFEDFRWSYHSILDKYNFFKIHYEAIKENRYDGSDEFKLFEILSKAIEIEAGLVAFAD